MSGQSDTTMHFIPSDSDPADVITIIDVDSEDEGQGPEGQAPEPTIGSLLFTFHFMEVFSPFRIAAAICRLGMTMAGSFDLLSDCDLLSTAGRQEVLKTLMSKRPLMLMCSPPCTMYSELMRLWNAKKMNPQVKALREKDAYLMVCFSMELCRLQDDAGRFYCYEHPYKAASWKLDIVACLNLSQQKCSLGTMLFDLVERFKNFAVTDALRLSKWRCVLQLNSWTGTNVELAFVHRGRHRMSIPFGKEPSS